MTENMGLVPPGIVADERARLDGAGGRTFDVAQFVTDAYRGVLGRDPEQKGLEFYSDHIVSGRMTGPELIAALIRSTEFRLGAGKLLSTVEKETGPSGCLALEAMELFHRWERYDGPGRPGYVTNFLGALTNVRYVNGLDRLSGIVEGYPLPGNFHADALEWVGTLQAVLEAGNAFMMIELGAGWGPWCAIGYRAAKMRGIPGIRVIGVEGDAGHVGYMRESFAANEMPEDCAKVVAGVVGTSEGTAYFPKVKDPSRAYGGAAAYGDASTETGPFAHFVSSQASLLDTVEEVRCYSLVTLMQDMPFVDLIHCDIQGEEENLFRHGIELITAKVGRCVIGTHSFAIDRALINLLPSSGWVLEGIDACRMREQDGKLITVRDGTQVWRNATLEQGAVKRPPELGPGVNS
jgi:Domain of unknown function (DUF4214)